MSEHEHKQVEIIRRVYNTRYSHAEMILFRLRELEATHSPEEAIDILHAEVAGEE